MSQTQTLYDPFKQLNLVPDLLQDDKVDTEKVQKEEDEFFPELNLVQPEKVIEDTEETKQIKPWYLDDNNEVDLSRYDESIDAKKTTLDSKIAELDPQENADPYYFDVEGFKEAKKGLTYEDQVNNKELIGALKRRFVGDYSNDELIEMWAGEQHWINWNLPRLGYDAVAMQNLTKQEKQDYLLMMQTWDQVDSFGDGSQSFWDQLLEIGGALMADPTTYVGIGTLGIGLIGKSGAKETTKAAIKAYLRDSVKAKTVLGATEAGIYTFADDAARQSIEQQAQGKAADWTETELDYGRSALATTLGIFAGGGITFSLDKILRKPANKAADDVNLKDDADTKVREESDISAKSETITETVDEPNTKPVVEERVAVKDSEIEDIDFDVLPKELKGAKPRYKGFNINFKNDVQKAVYIASNRTRPSKRQQEYMEFARKELGLSEKDVFRLGDVLRAKLKNSYAKVEDKKSGGLLEIDVEGFPTKKKVKKAEKPEVKKGEETTEVKPEPIEEKPLTAEEKKQASELSKKTLDEEQPAPEKVLNKEYTESVLTEQEFNSLMDQFMEKQDVVLHQTTRDKARKKFLKFKTKQEVIDFLENLSEAVRELPENGVLIRMLFSDAENKLAKIWQDADTPRKRANRLAKFPEAFRSLQLFVKSAQQSAAQIGRALNAYKIKVNVLDDLAERFEKFNEKIQKANQEAAERNLEGKEYDDFINNSIEPEELLELEKAMDELIKETEFHNNSLRRSLPAHDAKEGRFRKFSRVIAEIWTSANLWNTATQFGALVGTGLKRVTMKGESYIQYITGKGLDIVGVDKGKHLRWRQIQELNRGQWAQTIETWKMIQRLFKSTTGEGVEAQIQRESLDGWSTKWDDETTKGAINSDYIGFQDPNTVFKSFINKFIDSAGVITRGSFTALTLADDLMKRVYYGPYIRMKAAGIGIDKGLRGDALDAFINKYDNAYNLYYQKKGFRDNTMRLIIKREMEKFHKDNPDASYFEVTQAEQKAMDLAESQVAFTNAEKALLDEVGIDPAIHDEAVSYLREMLFQTDIPKDSKIATLIKNMRDIHPLGQTQLPYLKTVMNMTKDTLRRVPGINLFLRSWRADIAAGGVARDRAISEMVMGTTWMSLGYMLYKEGFITPSTDPSEYGIESTTNLKGSSINLPIFDSIPLNRIEPIGSFLRLTADYSAIYDEVQRLEQLIESQVNNPKAEADLEKLRELKTEWILSVFAATAKVFSEKSGMEQIRRLTRALTNFTSESAEQYWKDLIAGVIPARSGIEQAFGSEVIYEAKTLGEKFRKTVGMMGEEYGDREKIDLFGLPNSEATRNFVYWRTSNPDPQDKVEREIWKLKPNLKHADNILTLPNGVKLELDYKDHYELRKFMSDKRVDAKGRMEKVMQNSMYKKAPDGVSGDYDQTSLIPSKTKALEKSYNDSKARAKELFFQANRERLTKKYKQQIETLKLINQQQGVGQRDLRGTIFDVFAQ